MGVNACRLVILLCALGDGCAAIAAPDAAVTLREKHASLGEQLRQSPLGRPLLLDSTETPTRLAGDIYAVVGYPFDVVNTGLNNPEHWCDVMLLHVYTKYCRAMVEPTSTTLTVYIGKKTAQELAAATRLEFSYTVVTATPEYVEIMLTAKDGPLGTSDYLIRLEAVTLPNAKTFLHLTYSYATNFAGRLGMQAYLLTGGRGKVGFTVIGALSDGQPEFICGARGVVERNTMRYYLAIDSFLEFAGAAPTTQFEQRLQSWFSAVERYPRQLQELDRDAYLVMKRAEYLRQQTPR
jgi:hypothetical protein